MHMRVQIPAYTDHWMRGDRYGVIIGCSTDKQGHVILTVTLDKSGKTIRVSRDDCQDV